MLRLNTFGGLILQQDGQLHTGPASQRPQADRKMPIWPVNAWLFFSADDYRSSFAAELSGSMNWHSGEMRVTGVVSDGARVGTPIEQRMQLRRPSYEGSATVRFWQTLTARSPVCEARLQARPCFGR
jgi:hypothetical protein